MNPQLYIMPRWSTPDGMAAKGRAIIRIAAPVVNLPRRRAAPRLTERQLRRLVYG